MISKLKSILARSILKDSANYLLGQVLTMGLSFISMPIFTKLLSQGDYGKVALFSSFTAIIMPIITVGTSGSLANIYLKRQDEFKEYLGTVLLFLLGSISLFIILLYLSVDFIISIFTIDSEIIIFSLISAILSVPIILYNSVLIASKKSREYSILSFAKAVIILFVSWGLILNFFESNGFLGRVWGQIIGISLISTWSIYKLVKEAEFIFIKKHLSFALNYGIPLIPHSLSGIILAQFDRIIINDLTGDKNTGLYSIAYNVGNLMMVVVMALNQVWVPRFYENLKKNANSIIESYARKYAILMALIASFLIYFSKEVFMLLADEKFHASLGIVPYIVLSGYMVFLYTLYANYAFYSGNTKLIAINTFIAGISNIGLNYWLIPIYGYKVAAITTVVSFFLLFILHFINSKYILKMKVIRISSLFPSISILLFMTIVYYFVLFLDLDYFSTLFIKICCLAILLLIVATPLIKNKVKI